MSDNGTWVLLTPEPHRCKPPVPIFIPQEPPGSLWRCPCGTLWKVNTHRDWVRAGWRLRRKYPNEASD